MTISPIMGSSYYNPYGAYNTYSGSSEAAAQGMPDTVQEGEDGRVVIRNPGESTRKQAGRKSSPAECETCKNRKYQDGSDDPGVSFKSAAKISKGSAEATVRGHEYEHVNRNQAKADREGKEIVYQSVIIKHGICPECGDVYVTGGETTTVTRDKPQEHTDERFNVGLVDMQQNMGHLLDMLV